MNKKGQGLSLEMVIAGVILLVVVVVVLLIFVGGLKPFPTTLKDCPSLNGQCMPSCDTATETRPVLANGKCPVAGEKCCSNVVTPK